MHGLHRLAAVALSSTALGTAAHAWHFQARFVERVGNVDMPIIDGYSIPFDAPTRIRLQAGVFDDATGPAPAGGFIGWNAGTLAISGIPQPIRAGARRTPGRLNPFTFSNQANANGNPPLPNANPFFTLTDIDNTLGPQSPPWTGCDENGVPSPQPQPIIRGLNTFVSLYEVTLTPLDYYLVFDLSFQGFFITASEWRTVGTPFPPDCADPDDPSDDLPGSVTYAPLVAATLQFGSSITLVSNAVPGPSAAAVLLLGVLASKRHTRRPAFVR